jgi:predicted DNA-binding transcriptional regulator AlpA
MKTFEFSVIASGLDPNAEDFEARFYDNGCDDALVSFQNGHIIIDFARDAETFDEAVASALENVAAAGAHIDRLEPDPLVSLAEIAKRANLSRAAITNYHKGNRGDAFPVPVARITSESPLWEWASVAKWLACNNRLPRAAAVEAETVQQANRAMANGEIHIGAMLRRRAQEYERELCA